MSRSKRKSSVRRNASAADTPVAAASSVSCTETASAGPDDTIPAAPLSSGPLPLPGSVPPQASRSPKTGVSGLTCVLCCIICLLAGVLLGNLLPHVLEGRSGGGEPARPEAAAPSPAPAAVQAEAASPSAPAAPSAAAAAAPAQGAAQAMPPQAGANLELEHIGHLEKSLAANPQDVARWTELGNAYFDMHQPLKAIEAYERSLALRPGDPNVLTDLGIMYRESGQYELALRSFDRAMRADPSHENSRFNKGIVLLFDLHRHAEAKAVWQELLRINPRATAPDGTGLRTLIEQCDKPLP